MELKVGDKIRITQSWASPCYTEIVRTTKTMAITILGEKLRKKYKEDGYIKAVGKIPSSIWDQCSLPTYEIIKQTEDNRQ